MRDFLLYVSADQGRYLGDFLGRDRLFDLAVNNYRGQLSYPRRPLAPGITMKFLFAGGQYHGQMLPICDQSVRESAGAIEPPLRAGPGGHIYRGYRLARIGLAGGGERRIAVIEIARATRERLAHTILDAMSVALENYERVFQHCTCKHRVPLNAAPDDEPGVPGVRRPTRYDQEAWFEKAGNP